MSDIKRQTPHRGKQVTVAEFKRMWCDPEMTVADIARELDVCARSVWQRARHRGLLPRSQYVKPGNPPSLTAEDEAMYRAGVDAEEIAARRGIKSASVLMHMWRNGIKRDVRITRWNKPLTVSDYRALQLRCAMAASARETEAAMLDAEMVDNRKAAQRALGRAA